MDSGTRSRTPTSRRSCGNNVPDTAAIDTAGVGLPPRLTIPQEPPKVPRRPPSKGSKRETLADIAKRIPVELMRHYFNYPLRAAAEAMHISVTTLKRLCRRHGVKRWPHRQICGINRALNDLETQHETAKGEALDSVAEQLRQLHRRRDVIIELAFESEDEANCNGSDDAPLAAHKRRGRITSSDGVGSSASSSSSSPPSSPSHSQSASLAFPSVSPTAMDEDTPGEADASAAWWKSPPEIDLSSAAASLAKAVCSSERCSSKVDTIIRNESSSNGGKRSRRPSGSSGSGRAKGLSKPKSSAMFGSMPASWKASRPVVKVTMCAVTTAKHRSKSSPSIDMSSISAGATANTTSCTTTPVPFRPQPAPLTAGSSSSTKDEGEGGGASGGTSATPSLAPLIESAASVVSEDDGSSLSSSVDILGLESHESQHIDDLAVLGDLLFAPEEAALAAAATGGGARPPSLLSAHLSPGVLSYSASQCGTQGPCVPVCPQVAFSHDTLSPYCSYEHGFSAGLASASNWGFGLDWDANCLSSVGPL